MEKHRFAQVCGRQIHYKLIGDNYSNEGNPLLIFLHEGLGSIAQWKDFPAEISKLTSLPALVYDRYGYGQSQAFAEARTSKYLNDEAFVFLPELIAQLKIKQKIILIGHSDGGSIALLHASRFHDNILGVITEADHIFCEPITYQGIQDAEREYAFGKLKPMLQKFHGDKADSVFYGWSRVWLDEKNINWSIQDYLTFIQCPVLAIQGTEDMYGSEKQLQVKKQCISGEVRIMFLKDCGHVPHFQEKKIVTDGMVEFIRSIVEKNIVNNP